MVSAETIGVGASSIRILDCSPHAKAVAVHHPRSQGADPTSVVSVGSAALADFLLQCIMPLIQVNFRLRAGNRAVIGLDLTA
jgi:hypothetical protein